MKIFDLHCDTIMKFYQGRHLAEIDDAYISLSKLKNGECLTQCFAIYVPTGQSAAHFGITDTPDEYVHNAYSAFRREMELYEADISQVFSVKDILANEKAGKMGAMLTIEDCISLEGKMERLDEYYSLGVRMASITWNHENSLGYPNSDDPAAHMLGLKPFGKDVIRRMNELGIAADVSHLSEGGFWDVANITAKPFIASHSCARALCNVSRNLTDAQLRAVADKGGLVGMNYLPKFIHPVASKEENVATIEQIAAHMLHIKDVAGIDTLGLGSDFDGFRGTLEFTDYGGMQRLVDGLGKYFTDDELEKICRGNALRVFRDIIGE